jgi:hypothetical protein
MNKIVKIIFEPVYRHDVFFISGCSLKEANKILKKYDIGFTEAENPSAGITGWFSHKDSKKIKGIVFAIWIENRNDFYSLVHETTHLCIKIFELSNILIDSSPNTSEAFSFYLEHWVRRLWKEMSKK